MKLPMHWPQYTLLAWWAVWLGVSIYNVVPTIETFALVAAWFGAQAFLLWMGGFWSQRP